jgi:hypothetical protein
VTRDPRERDEQDGPDQRDGAGDPELTPAEEDAVRALLGALPDPPMPDDVLARIDAALVGAAASIDQAIDQAIDPPIDLHAHRTRRGPGTRLLQAAAVVVLLALGGFAVVAGLESRGGDGAGTTAQLDAGSTAAAPPVTRSGISYDTGDLAAQARGRVEARAMSATSITGTESNLLSAPASAPQDEDAVAGMVGDGAARSEDRPEDAAAPEARPADVRALLRDDARLAACITALTGREGVTPLVLDVGRWQGGPAGLIVLPVADEDDDDPTRAEAWLVGATCSAADGAFPLARADVFLS